MQPAPPGAPPPGTPPPPGYYPPPGYGYPPPRKSSLLWLWILLGVLGAVMVLGILAAIAIPSFVDYQKKAKRSEAELQLMQIGKSARYHYIENAAFPTTAAGPTPSTPCCDGPGHKCAADPSAWAADPWLALDVEPYGPHYFRYAYTPRGDGQGFTATATGDLDCDGTPAVFSVTGAASGANAQLGELVRPAHVD